MLLKLILAAVLTFSLSSVSVAENAEENFKRSISSQVSPNNKVDRKELRKANKVVSKKFRNNRPVILQLVGEGKVHERMVPGRDEPATCFEGLDVIDLNTGKVVGTGVDCLSDIVMGENGSMDLFGTSFFSLKSGEIVTQGHITVQPVLRYAETRDGIIATHITGASSDAPDTVVSGTGLFEDLAANVRLQGMVDGSDLDKGILRFSCFFTFTNIHEK